MQGDEHPYVTLEQAAEQYQIKPRALYSWLRAAEMTPVQIDGRTKGLTYRQFVELGRAHGRILLSGQVEALEQRVRNLEARLARIEERMAASEGKNIQAGE